MSQEDPITWIYVGDAVIQVKNLSCIIPRDEGGVMFRMVCGLQIHAPQVNMEQARSSLNLINLAPKDEIKVSSPE